MDGPDARAAAGARLGCRLLVAGLAASLAGTVAVAIGMGVDAALLPLAATAALAAASVPIGIRPPTDVHEPIWAVVLLVAVGTTAKSFYLLLGPRPRVDFLLLDKTPRQMVDAALVITLGLLCFAAGYVLGDVRVRLPALEGMATAGWNRRRLAWAVALLSVVGVASFAVYAARLDLSLAHWSDLSSKRFVPLPGSRYLGTNGYLRWGAMQLEIAFYLVALRWLATRRRLLSASALPMALLLLAAIAFPVFVSSRKPVLLLLIRIVVLWACLRGVPRLRHLVAVGAAGLLVAGSMLALRRHVAGGRELLSYLGPARLLEVTVGGRHFLDLTKTAHVLAGVPDPVPFQHGRSLVTWMVAPIPRCLWPDKPAIGVGIDLGPALFGTTPQTGVPPGIVGELYLNFGLPGVLLGLFAVGALLRCLYATLRPHFPGEAIVLLYTLLSTRLAFGMMGAVSGVIARLLKELVPVLLVLVVCLRRPTRGAREPAG